MTTVGPVDAAQRTVEFVVAPDLSNVAAADKALVQLIGLVALNLHKPAIVCVGWRVDAYEDHYNLVFDLVSPAPPITDGHMRVLKELNYVRVQHVWVNVRDGALELSIQVAKSGLLQVVTEETVLHIARVCRIEAAAPDAHKRPRTE
jgi:hypothetical protein